MNKKYLSVLLIVIAGLAAFLSGFYLFKSLTSSPQEKLMKASEGEALQELSIDERPYVTLTPRPDGHELTLKITNVPEGFKAVEYELGYKNKDGVQQGATGKITVSSPVLERKILLGTCSSGRCRYDEGVERGTLTLRFRDDQGKLIAKFETGFTLNQGGSKLSSYDGKFSISGNLGKVNFFYVVMGTFGLPSTLPTKPTGEPYGVFASGKAKILATVSITGAEKIWGWDGTGWSKLQEGKTTFLGTFISSAE
jgi:hypothetical protein